MTRYNPSIVNDEHPGNPVSDHSEMPKKQSNRNQNSGKLRIGDHWNAITIIALSQSNPLKAVAEFVENSIDARARHITVVRGKERGQPYLRITDDGSGVPRDEEGLPDFKYVATHVCDSVKRRLQNEAREGIQGEFGIGLLSFWTVGEEMTMACKGADGKLYEMRMAKGDPGYSVTTRRRLLELEGTELTIKPLLPGIRTFSGEKLQWYLASELRDRIRSTGVEIRIIDRLGRSEYLVEPRQFTGQLLHHLPQVHTEFGDAYTELFLTAEDPANHVSLYRSGTRVLENIAEIEELRRPPWTSCHLQGILEVPFLNLTPGTRTGVIQDEAFAAFRDALGPLEDALLAILEEQQKAEEEQANRQTLKSIQKAFREALLTLPEEEYDWFDIRKRKKGNSDRPRTDDPNAVAFRDPDSDEEPSDETDPPSDDEPSQKEFFEHAGPLFSVRISPSSCVVSVGKTKRLRAIARDRQGRQLEPDSGVAFSWRVAEGEGHVEEGDREIITFQAPDEPTLTRVEVEASQEGVSCTAEGLITVTDSLLDDDKKGSSDQRGLPGYTFQKAPGKLWRSRFDKEQNVVVINNGHRDFVFASRNKSLKLRYICRLFCKELVFHNFPGYSADDLLERMIELSLYTEENLR